MENKEMKNTAAELNDETLDNVSGGLLKPIILNVDTGITIDSNDAGANITSESELR